MRRSSCLVVMILGLLHAPAVLAQEDSLQKLEGQGATIAIVAMGKCCAGEAWPEAEKHTDVEFYSLHFKVVTVFGRESGAAEKMAELMEIANEQRAVCTVRITRKPEKKAAEVDVWMWDKETGKTAFRHLVMDNLTDQEGPSVVALKVVELLRTALMELRSPEPEQDESGGSIELLPVSEIEESESKGAKPGTGPSGISLKAPLRKHGIIGLRLGFVGLGSPGGAGGMGAVELAVRWNPMDMLALELNGFLSVASRDIRHLDARASCDAAAVRLCVFWDFINMARVRFGVGAGGGVLLAWSKGHAPDPYWVRTVTGHAACISAGLQMAVVLMRYLWLRVGFSIGLTLPDEISVIIADQKAASFGRPLMEGFLGLEGSYRRCAKRLVMDTVFARDRLPEGRHQDGDIFGSFTQRRNHNR